MTSPEAELSFERWVALLALTEGVSKPEPILASFAVSLTQMAAADQRYVAELAEEASRGESALRSRFDSLYLAARDEGPTRLVNASEDADEGTTLPLPLKSSRRATSADLAALSELSERILPFSTPKRAPRPPIENPNDMATLVAAPRSILLAEAALQADDAIANENESSTLVAPIAISLDDLAAVARALRNDEDRAAVLSRHGLSELALATVTLIWKERMRQKPEVFEQFRELLERPLGEP